MSYELRVESDEMRTLATERNLVMLDAGCLMLDPPPARNLIRGRVEFAARTPVPRLNVGAGFSPRAFAGAVDE
jgi:hypothetical protein